MILTKKKKKKKSKSPTAEIQLSLWKPEVRSFKAELTDALVAFCDGNISKLNIFEFMEKPEFSNIGRDVKLRIMKEVVADVYPRIG